MATPVLDNLTSDSNTRELLGALVSYHHAKGPALAVARLALESAADALAKGTGAGKQIVLTDPDQAISVGQFFGSLSREQAGRFLDELFIDIVPHLANQAAFFKDHARGQTESGMAIVSNKAVKGLSKILSNPSSELQAVEVRVNRLVWVDDQERTLTSNVDFEVAVEPAARTGRGLTL